MKSPVLLDIHLLDEKFLNMGGNVSIKENRLYFGIFKS